MKLKLPSRLQNCGIYEIVNIINNRRYVGQTGVSFKLRWQYHINDLMQGTHHNYYLQRDFYKYGVNAFSFRILERIFDKRLLLRREKYWIDKRAREKFYLYNIRK